MTSDSLSGLFLSLQANPTPSSPWPPSSPVAIYGAGSFGQSLCSALLAESVPVNAFIDRMAQPGQSWNGMPILHPDGVEAQAWSSWTILLGIHNPGTSVRDLHDELTTRGCRRLLTPIEILNRLGPAFGNRYWLAPSRHLLGFENDIRAARGLFEPESQALFDAVIAQRATGDYHRLPQPTHALDDYLPADVAAFNRPLRIVDGGAYDGDTLRGLLKHGFALEAVAAFEPDPENFAKLDAWVRVQPEFNAVLWPCGLYSHTTQLHFSAGQGEASAITPGGETMIQCVSIDEAMHGFCPSLIKLDVEGAEPDALRGATETIHKHTPFITAGLYHHPFHLWQIPMLLHSIQPGYRMYLRQHAENGFDLWLHAVPSRKNA
jgi:FkbM family methyltransferase